MAKQTLVGKTIKISQMSVAGGDLPDKWSIKLDIEIDCSSATMEQLMEVACSGHSARVRLQTKLRLKSTTELEAIKAAGVYKLTFADCISAKVATPVKPEDALMALSQVDFITWCKDHMGINDKQALAIYNRKHKIEVK